MSLHRGMPQPARAPQRVLGIGSMRISDDNFVHDQLANGLTFQVLIVVDKGSQESVLLETDFRLTSR